jgi:hypothetical protein
VAGEVSQQSAPVLAAVGHEDASVTIEPGGVPSAGAASRVGAALPGVVPGLTSESEVSTMATYVLGLSESRGRPWRKAQLSAADRGFLIDAAAPGKPADSHRGR